MDYLNKKIFYKKALIAPSSKSLLSQDQQIEILNDQEINNDDEIEYEGENIEDDNEKNDTLPNISNKTKRPKRK